MVQKGPKFPRYCYTLVWTNTRKSVKVGVFPIFYLLRNVKKKQCGVCRSSVPLVFNKLLKQEKDFTGRQSQSGLKAIKSEAYANEAMNQCL